MSLQYGLPFPVMEIKAASDGSWEVSGYASTFGNVDLGGDVILRGAFDQSLSDGRKVKFLFAHDPSQVLGVPLDLKVDDHGLFGRFRISRTRLGEEVHTLLRDGALDSFSIGGFVHREDVDFDPETGARLIKNWDLLEVSQVAIPMNPQATVTGVKDLLAQVYLPGGIRKDQQSLPFDEHCELVLSMIEGFTARSKSYADLRESQGRKLSTSFVERLTTVRTAADELLSIKAPDPKPFEPEDFFPALKESDQGALPPVEKAAGPDMSARIALRRARLRHAGILEMPSDEHDRRRGTIRN